MKTAQAAPEPVTLGEQIPYGRMSMEELLNVPVGVAALNLTPILAAPGIVTLITEEEIHNSGARDLVDVFESIPGLKVTFDTTGTLALSVRGVFANEGKVLLLWNGHELNEGFFGSIYLGNRYPLDQISRIEVIRGPGSAIYGGYAGLAVIDIITKSAKDLSGAAIRGEVGQMVHTYGRRNISLAYGKAQADYRFKLSAFLGEAQRTDRDINTFTFPADTFPEVSSSNTTPITASLAEKTGLRPFFSTLDVGYKDLDVSLMVDQYESDSAYIRKVFSRPTPLQFHSYFGKVTYRGQFTNGLKITPSFSYKRQGTLNQPEADFVVSEIGSSWYDDKYTDLFIENLVGSYDWSEEVNTLLGLELRQQKTNSLSNFTRVKPPPFTQWTNNSAVFAQAQLRSSIANVTAGVRYNRNSISEPALVPRAAISKQINSVYLKALYAHAYRTPTVANAQSVANLSGILKPETFKTAEFQIGYQPSPQSYFSANFFKTNIDDAIVFNSLLLGNVNETTLGVVGLELESKLKQDWGDLSLNYSYYRASDQSVRTNLSPPDPDAALGIPNHKLAFNAHLKVTQDFSINPSFVYQGSAFAQVYNSALREVVIGKFEPVFVPNVYFRYTHFLIRHLEAGVGVYNFTNADYFFHQGFNARNPSYPGGSREVLLRLEYEVRT